MEDNKAQYKGRKRAEQDRTPYVRNGGVRHIQDDRGQSAGGQYVQGSRNQNNGGQNVQKRRTQNNGMPTGGRPRSEKERFLWQQQQQLQQQQKVLKKRMGMISLFVCIVLLVNVVAAVGIYIRMHHMSEVLKIIESQMPAGLLENSMNEAWLSSGSRAGQEASSTADRKSALNPAASVTGQDYVDLCGLEYVDRPQERTWEQVLKRLDELSKDDERIAEILENSYKYPDKLLEALANNPEMTDFVLGYEYNAGKVSGVLTQDEMKQDFPLFLQWDPRWGYGDYGDGSNIALAGCGPTCLSMALFYLTGDESLTPDKMAEYSMKNGYYISGTGTAWALLQDVPEQYGISVSQPKAEEYTMKTALDNGSVIICSMGPGDFTAAGHFIVIYGYDKKGFLVNDPNCVARSRQSWSFSELKGQIKNMWVLGGSVKYQGVTSVTDYID